MSLTNSRRLRNASSALSFRNARRVRAPARRDGRFTLTFCEDLRCVPLSSLLCGPFFLTRKEDTEHTAQYSCIPAITYLYAVPHAGSNLLYLLISLPQLFLLKLLSCRLHAREGCVSHHSRCAEESVAT